MLSLKPLQLSLRFSHSRSRFFGHQPLAFARLLKPESVNPCVPCQFCSIVSSPCFPPFTVYIFCRSALSLLFSARCSFFSQLLHFRALIVQAKQSTCTVMNRIRRQKREREASLKLSLPENGGRNVAQAAPSHSFEHSRDLAKRGDRARRRGTERGQAARIANKNVLQLSRAHVCKLGKT